jgi:hypothetical protein
MQPTTKMAAAAHDLLAELQQRGMGDAAKAAEHRELARKCAVPALSAEAAASSLDTSERIVPIAVNVAIAETLGRE